MKYKEIDVEGEQILKSMSKGIKLNYWMYSQIKPFIKGKTLEIGSGIGNISRHFIENSEEICLSDIRDQYIKSLKSKYPKNEVLKIDLVDPDFDLKHSKLFETFNLVFALNVIEHIQDDKKALINLTKLLKPDGYLYILVPAHQILYNNFDKTLFHYRRYNKRKLIDTFPNSIKIIKSWYFNFAGIFGWLIVGKILNKKIIPESNMILYNLLTPLFKLLDYITFNKVGLSVIVVGQKSSKMKLSILIPVYNEEDSILNILNELKKVNLIDDIEKQIILIDDCSLDNSKNIIDNFILNNNDLDILVESHTKNKGKGAAIQTGIKIASGDIIVIQDADLEYDPKEFNLLNQPNYKWKSRCCLRQ